MMNVPFTSHGSKLYSNMPLKMIVALAVSLIYKIYDGEYTVSNRNAGRTVETPELRSYNAEFRSFSMDSPPFLVF